MNPLSNKMNKPLQLIKSMWQWSWQSLWQGDLRTWPVVLIGYGTLLILALTGLVPLVIANHIGSSPDLQLPLTTKLHLILLSAILMLVANFFMAAFIVRAYAWLKRDKMLASRMWIIARQKFLQLFAIYLMVTFLDIVLGSALNFYAVHLPSLLRVIVSIAFFLLYLILLTIPFLINAAIVLESQPFTKAVAQGIKLFMSHWSVSGTVLYLGVLFPFFALLSLLAMTSTITGLNVIIALFVAFGFYPFFLILVAFANILIYYNAKQLSLERQSKGDYEVRQA